jgi:hypothetical protein
MRQKSWKGFTKWLPGMFPIPLQSLAEVYICSRGPFWPKCILNYCTVLYFSEVEWFREHFEAARCLKQHFSRRNIHSRNARMWESRRTVYFVDVWNIR